MEQIKRHPIDTRVARDLRHYRGKTAGHSDEIKRGLRRKDSIKYPPNRDFDVDTYDVYRDFAMFVDRGNPRNEYRLGGGLPLEAPDYLDSLPDPTPVEANQENGEDTVIQWTHERDGEEVTYTVRIRHDGAVIHTDDDGNELEEAHHYMHGIFDKILYQTRHLLERINQKLEAYAAVPPEGDATSQGAEYVTAVAEFEQYRADLNQGDSPYSSALNFADIYPVVTNEGFIVSARVKLNWKNPYHSSSTIKIP